MKQKQVKACPNVVKQGKPTNKATPAKESRMEVDESDNEAEVKKKQIVAKTPLVKKAAKNQDTVAEQSSDEEEHDEDEDQDDKEQNDEVEEDDETSEEEGDDDEEHEQDENGVEDNDDEAPSEESIEKEEPTIPSQVKMGPIPDTVPYNRVISIYRLPKKCNKWHLIEAFDKYGTIEQIHILKKASATVANIAYKTEKAALEACKDDKKVKILDLLVRIKRQRRTYNDHDRCVLIRNVKTGTSEEELRHHFESCGEIEAVKLFTRYNEIKLAFVTFTDKSAIPEALKLNNSVLNGVNIRVTANTEKQTITEPSTNEVLTIVVKNTQNFENIDVEKLKTIFSKCGEISILNVVCRKDVLAFITFKNKMAVEKALKLSGKTEEEIELDLELYDPFKRRTSIHVSNLPRDCTEEDLTNVFSKAGEIESITLKNGYAKIDFKDCEGYCKSFLYNETFIRGKIIFIRPHSIHKPKVFKPFQNRGFKRPAQNSYSVFKPKKAKVF